MADDHRRRAAGACWVMPAIDCIDRPRIAPGAAWTRRSGERSLLGLPAAWARCARWRHITVQNRVYRATP
jgi:hypothetical protein